MGISKTRQIYDKDYKERLEAVPGKASKVAGKLYGEAL
jgi:hypothetical protein